MTNSFYVTASGVKQPAFSDLTGSPSQAQGVAALINGSAVSLTGQTNSIGSTTLYAVPSSGAGLYRVSYSAIDTSAGTGTDALTITIGWNNGSGSNTFTSPSVSLISVGAEIAGDITLYSAASQNITYLTAVTSILGSPQYSLRLRVEYLG